MNNYFCKYPLHEVTKDLVDVAMGRKEAELVIKNAKLVNVCTHEILNNMMVAITKGRIALVGDATHCIGADTKVIDAEGKYLTPSFMDGHMHVESSMLTVGEYARAVIPHGTSGIFFDPHEICNVLGLKGVRYMLEDSKRTPLKAMLCVPSCVPAVPGFEDTGSKIDSEDVREAMTWKESVGLGEMMNFVGIQNNAEGPHAIVAETIKADKCPTGHYTIPETGAGLNAYIAAGMRCDHESVREIDALTKMRLGMYAQLREGSAWHDLVEVSKAITNHEVDSRYAQLCTDDSHPHTLYGPGHLDRVIRKAMEYGIDFVTAIQMVTINVATCFQLEHEMGSITPNKCADMVLIDDIKTCHVTDVFIDGQHVAHDGKLIIEFGPYSYPKDAYNTVHLDKLSAKDFVIPSDKKEVKVRAISVEGGKTITTEDIKTLKVENGNIKADPSQDVLKAFVFERHHRTGKVGKGFLTGFGIKEGALAQTVAHDAHNLLVVGTNDEDMAIAANALIDCGGGLVVVQNGKVIALAELPVAGLMSEENAKVMSEKIGKIEEAWKKVGCTLPSPFMTMGIASLACIPNLRLTNRGIVDCINFKFLDLIVE
jgi:adenine deaminase